LAAVAAVVVVVVVVMVVGTGAEEIKATKNNTSGLRRKT